MTGRLWPFPDRDGETSPVTRFGGRSENSTAYSEGWAMLNVCLGECRRALAHRLREITKNR